MFKFPILGQSNKFQSEFVEARLTEVEDSGQIGIWVSEIITQLN